MLEYLFPGVIGWFMKDKGDTPYQAIKKVCQPGIAQHCLGHTCQSFRPSPGRKWWHFLIYKKRYICGRFR